MSKLLNIYGSGRYQACTMAKGLVTPDHVSHKHLQTNYKFTFEH